MYRNDALPGFTQGYLVFSHRFIHRLGKLLGIITAYFIWKSLFLLKSKIIQQIITFRCLVLGAENFVPGLDPTTHHVLTSFRRFSLRKITEGLAASVVHPT